MPGAALALAALGNLAFLAHAHRRWGHAARDVPRVRALRIVVCLATGLAAVTSATGPAAWPVSLAAVAAGLAVFADPVPRVVALWATWVLLAAVVAGIAASAALLLLIGVVGVVAPLVAATCDGPPLWRTRAQPLPRATLRR